MLKILDKIFSKETKKQEYIILQWGKNSSLIQNITSGNFEVFIIGNQDLMNLDERGNIV